MDSKKRTYAPRLPPAERREQLLDAALAVIDADGYGGVSMEAVARVAGVTKPVLYELFANRGELLRALLEREETRALTQLAEVMPSEPAMDPDELVAAGLVAFLGSVEASPATWRLILLPTDGTPEVVRDHVEAGRQTVRQRLEELLAWGIAARGGPQGVDIELAAQSLIALGEHLGRLVLTRPDEFTPERVGSFVRGILGALERPGGQDAEGGGTS
jgi:AcrR family transcriptional regulator